MASAVLPADRMFKGNHMHFWRELINTWSLVASRKFQVVMSASSLMSRPWTMFFILAWAISRIDVCTGASAQAIGFVESEMVKTIPVLFCVQARDLTWLTRRGLHKILLWAVPIILFYGGIHPGWVFRQVANSNPRPRVCSNISTASSAAWGWGYFS